MNLSRPPPSPPPRSSPTSTFVLRLGGRGVAMRGGWGREWGRGIAGQRIEPRYLGRTPRQHQTVTARQQEHIKRKRRVVPAPGEIVPYYPLREMSYSDVEKPRCFFCCYFFTLRLGGCAPPRDLDHCGGSWGGVGVNHSSALG